MENDTVVVVDRYWLVYLFFLFQGLGALFSWNVFITAESYYSTRLKDTAISSNFENVFSVLFSFCNVLGLAFATRSVQGLACRVLSPYRE
jgi:hypothetical protein